jgi:hypothetical protein
MKAPPKTARPDIVQLLFRRAEALARFAQWEARHPSTMAASAAVEGVGTLYELLPADRRRRRLDVTGVARLHTCLKALSRSPR